MYIHGFEIGNRNTFRAVNFPIVYNRKKKGQVCLFQHSGEACKVAGITVRLHFEKASMIITAYES